MKQVKHVLNIKYVQLDTDLIPYFRKYDIFDQLNCLDKTGSFALGAFVKGDDGKDHPVAVKSSFDHLNDVFRTEHSE